MASGDTLAIWMAMDNIPPTSSYATLDSRGPSGVGHMVLDFSGTSAGQAIFPGILPTSYGGNGVTVKLWVAFTTATSGGARFEAAFERFEVGALDIDADAFGAQQGGNITAPGTSGQFVICSIPFTNGSQMAGLLAGEAFRLRINRNFTDAADTITTDAEVLRVMLSET